MDVMRGGPQPAGGHRDDVCIGGKLARIPPCTPALRQTLVLVCSVSDAPALVPQLSFGTPFDGSGCNARRALEPSRSLDQRWTPSADVDAKEGGDGDPERGQRLRGDWVLFRFECYGWCDVVSRVLFLDRDGDR